MADKPVTVHAKKIDVLKSKVIKELREENRQNVKDDVEQTSEQIRVSLLGELKAYVDDRIAELLLGTEEPTPVEPEPEPVEPVEPEVPEEPKEPKKDEEDEEQPTELKAEKTVYHGKTKHR